MSDITELIMLCCDTSTSMACAWESRSRLDAVKMMIKSMMDTSCLHANNLYGLISFNRHVSVIKEFVSPNEIKECVDTLSHMGPTSTFRGICVAVQKLIEKKKELGRDIPMRIFLITDGCDTAGGENEAAKMLYDAGIRLDSMIINKDIDIRLIALSKMTGGVCFNPQTVEEAIKMVETEPFVSVAVREFGEFRSNFRAELDAISQSNARDIFDSHCKSIHS